MDIEEFARANGVSDRVFDHLHSCYTKKQAVDPLIHQKMMELFRLYLIVGGMPAAVACYLQTHNLYEAAQVQQSVLTLYKKDIARYDPKEKLYLEDIFDLIPSELNAKNKRFILKDLHQDFKLSRYHNSFLWLANAGVVMPTYNEEEPTLPLRLNQQSNLFKLFLCDVGLLAATYANGIQLALLNGETLVRCLKTLLPRSWLLMGMRCITSTAKSRGNWTLSLSTRAMCCPLRSRAARTTRGTMPCPA